ncbi:GNAT family N-acetyltransferase [Ktedonosporobacter rubrisoli]|uniref:GNAT family N-acetyltransferase n=1 Tax=Ktedonosporobacter rubrisoli TaxID=2509675 RepID=A0A4P6JQ83_KTERU|nr:GNAT family N-acetyltransferase [Ktedonosporobacter rubrisoli]QBD76926.1 GNAT family N-acetyltransferase [Ktedonosporobacter rubrisoli]
MSTDVTIRGYRIKDQEQIKQCIIELQEFERGLEADRIEGERIVERNFQEMQEAHLHDESRIFVAEVAEKVVGFINVRPVHSDQTYLSSLVEYVYISDIVVLQAYRERGIGARLLQRAEEFARQKGISVLQIEALARNQQALDVYQRAGFRPYEIMLLKQIT